MVLFKLVTLFINQNKSNIDIINNSEYEKNRLIHLIYNNILNLCITEKQFVRRGLIFLSSNVDKLGAEIRNQMNSATELLMYIIENIEKTFLYYNKIREAYINIINLEVKILENKSKEG